MIIMAKNDAKANAHYRHRKAQGLSPNFYWSSVRGP